MSGSLASADSLPLLHVSVSKSHAANDRNLGPLSLSGTFLSGPDSPGAKTQLAFLLHDDVSLQILLNNSWRSLIREVGILFNSLPGKDCDLRARVDLKSHLILPGKEESNSVLAGFNPHSTPSQFILYRREVLLFGRKEVVIGRRF